MQSNNPADGSEYEAECLALITAAGDAKSKVFEALEHASRGKELEADHTLEQARQAITEAKRVHLRLITEEAGGARMPPTILLCHAMDILATAESECNIAQHVIRLLNGEKARGRGEQSHQGEIGR